MSVEKLDTVKLLKEKIPFTIHSNYVLQNLCEPLPLAIWCYLTSLPDDWEVHRNQLMNHFNIGRDKLATALKYLNEFKLIEYLQAKDETGKFAISHIVVKNGVEFEVIHKNVTAPLKNRTTVLPVSGESATTNTIRNTNEIKNKNKSFCDKTERTKSKSVDNITAEAETAPAAKKKDWKEANQTKHSWANKAKEPPRADVTSQSTSYDPSQHANTERFDPTAPGYQAFLNANPAIKRAHERRKKNAAKANELPTGTEVQPQDATRSLSDEQGAANDVDRGETDSPPVRGSNRLMEARGVHSYLKEAGMAGTH